MAEYTAHVRLWGAKQTSTSAVHMSAYGGKADINRCRRNAGPYIRYEWALLEPTTVVNVLHVRPGQEKAGLAGLAETSDDRAQ
jgi:hypothetical protein